MKSTGNTMSNPCANSSSAVKPMLSYSANGTLLTFREPCGLEHRWQTICVKLADDRMPEYFVMRDRRTGRKFAGQRSLENRQLAFIEFALMPDETLELEFHDTAPALPKHSVSITEDGEFLVLDNGVIGIQIPTSQQSSGHPCSLTGPVAAIHHSGGKWFGTTYFDTLSPLGETSSKIIESGPLRSVIEFSTSGGEYTARMTLDARQHHVAMDERFESFEGDQLVWIFSGGELPEYGLFLNQTAGYETRYLPYVLDHELARLGPWSQQSQLSLSDGFAFALRGADTIFGAVTLDGGSWRGNRLNSLDAATVRLRNGDRRTRRLVHPYAKADQVTGPAGERIPVRDRSNCQEALCWAGWLGSGRRVWGLAAFTGHEFRPAAGDDFSRCTVTPLNHFEDHATRPMCEEQQAVLRKLHIENIFPLQQQLDCVYESNTGSPCQWSFRATDAFMREIIAPGKPDRVIDDRNFLQKVTEYLDSRVISFWYGAGIISTNPVSSRRIAPYLFLVEELSAAGKVPSELLARLRARGLFLAALFHRQGYYAGDTAMIAADSPDSLDPTMQGMMNQNFYTDVINVHGTAGLLYPDNPHAAEWVDTFVSMFSRQLDFHVYENGVWEESHTYFQHVLLTMLPGMIMLKDAGRFNFFADPRLQKMLRAALSQMTPHDTRTADCRHLTAFGDHAAEIRPYNVMWNIFVRMVAPHNPMLAANLNAFAADAGGKAEPGIPATPAPWKSCQLHGLGAFLRSYATDGSETLFALRSGKAWGHHHCDDSSFQLFSSGRMLIGDAGHSTGAAGEMKFIDVGHSRWTVPGRRILNYHWKFNRGWITELDLDGHMPYATCYTPVLLERVSGVDTPFERPLRHFRSVIQLSSNEFVLIDSTWEPTPSQYNFHLGTTNATIAGSTVQAVYGNVELRLYSLTGEQPVSAGTVVDTTHICFEAEATQPFSAFVIQFGQSELPRINPEITFDAGLITLHTDKAVHLRHIPI